MSDVTGGAVRIITNLKILNVYMEELANQFISPPGVMV
jgi:hypothetical protein